MGCSWPYQYNSENSQRQSPLNSYYKKRIPSQVQSFDRRGPRRKTCRVVTCIEDHQHHYCKTCGDNNSDHFSKKCKIMQWSPSTKSSNQSQYFIKLKTNASSNFVKNSIAQQQYAYRKSYENRGSPRRTQKKQYEQKQKYTAKENKQNMPQTNYQSNAENRVLFPKQNIGYGGSNHNPTSSKTYFERFKQNFFG